MRERLSVFCSVCADMSKSINIFRLFDCIRGIRDILFFSQVKQAEMHQSDECKAQVCAWMIWPSKFSPVKTICWVVIDSLCTVSACLAWSSGFSGSSFGEDVWLVSGRLLSPESMDGLMCKSTLKQTNKNIHSKSVGYAYLKQPYVIVFFRPMYCKSSYNI